MEKSNKSGFIRDIVIKVFLILLFVFLITLLFPMPNLTPFYDAVFNNNVQTMKDAAEKYFTKERMPEKVGDSKKLTLQEMLDKKLILPFLDKDGKECNLKKSYVQVTKKETEYELEVHLSCGKDDNYIVEPLGCYNYCNDSKECNCSCEGKVSTDENGNVTIETPNNSNTDNGKYKLQYLYTRTITDTDWVTGNYQANKEKESDDVKLVDTKTEYTGKKKVSSGTDMYKHIKYAYKDNWTYDTDWTEEVKQLTDRVKLADERTLYTGQKKYTETTNKYKHVKYAYKDNWTIDTDWTEEVKQQTDKLKLYAERTLYTGQRKYSEETTQYKHEKYEYKDNWKDINWTTTKYNTSSSVILTDTRYTVRKTTGTWSSYVKDSTWRTSKPANTPGVKEWSNAYEEREAYGDWKLKYSSYAITGNVPTTTDTRRYDFLYSREETCTSACNGKATVRVNYYDVYERSIIKEYRYMYRTYSTSTEEKVVSDPSSYLNSGYTVVKTEYKYRVNEPSKTVIDTIWTNSKTSPSGYTYANATRKLVTYKYENLGKWVTSYEKLGEYTYNVVTRKQYKYKYNNPEKYIEDTVWTDSKTSPSGYTYTGEYTTTTTTKFKDFNKWVTSEGELLEYTYNVKTKKQYKYKYNNPEKYIEDTIWTDSIVSPSGYTYTGEYKKSTKTSYVDLGRWVSSKEELGEYTYDVQTRKLYRYKYRRTTTRTESKWFDKNPGGDWVYANKTRKVRID